MPALARARAAASASLRVGVGRPLPVACDATVAPPAAVAPAFVAFSDFVRRNNGTSEGEGDERTQGYRSEPSIRPGRSPRRLAATSPFRRTERGWKYMSLMQRIRLIFNAKANKALDRAEDPNETLDYSYQKMLEMQQKVRRGVADVATSRKRLELQIKQMQQASDKLTSQAQQALAQGREDLAREALTRKSGIAGQLTDLSAQHAQLQAEEEKLTLANQRLQAKVEAFRTKKETLKATYNAAQAQTRVNEAFSGISEEMGDVGLAITRAEDKTAQMQARAGAIDELIAS